jgi:hypothetical protein
MGLPNAERISSANKSVSGPRSSGAATWLHTSVRSLFPQALYLAWGPLLLVLVMRVNVVVPFQ